MTVRTSGNASPALLRRDISVSFLPVWSPMGDRILFKDDRGIKLTSLDGKTVKLLGTFNAPSLAFSKNGKLLYGIDDESNHPVLFSFDPQKLKKTVIKQLSDEWEPDDDLLPSVRFTLDPDGKSLLYATSETQNDLWLLEGFHAPGWHHSVR